MDSFRSWKSFADVNMRSSRQTAHFHDFIPRIHRTARSGIMPPHNGGIADME